jgi:hypothetical protein
MDAGFVADIWGQVYQVKVNGVIPWAAVPTSRWGGGDPNPGTAFRVIEDGEHAIANGLLAYDAPDGSVTTFFANR